MGEVINEPDLFGAPPKAPAKGYEVHEHTFISGPRARGMFIRERQQTTSTFSHSHEGGDTYHSHPDTGPASFTIDKDDWHRATGMFGGGRKKYTKTPEGEQLPRIAPAPGEGEFEVHVGPPPPGWTGTGAGIAPVVRMILACDMRVSKVLPFNPTRKHGVA